MTTSVDTFFKEQPATYAAHERRRPSALSSAENDYAKDSSYISNKNRTDEKSFTDHLNGQTEQASSGNTKNDKSTTPTSENDYDKRSDLPVEKSSMENSEIAKEETVIPNQAQEASDLPVDAPLIPTATEEKNVTAHVINNDVGQTPNINSSAKEQAVPSGNNSVPSASNPIVNSNGTNNESANNAAQIANSSNMTPQSIPATAPVNTTTPFAPSDDKNGKKNTEADVRLPLDPTVKVVSTPGGPTLITNAQANISETPTQPVDNEVVKTAPSSVSVDPKGEKPTVETAATVLAGGAKPEIINNTTDSKSGTTANTNTQHSEEIKPNGTALPSQEKPLDTKPIDIALQSGVAVIESSRVIAGAPVQNQANNQTAAPGIKNSGAKNNVKGSDAANVQGGATQQPNQNVSAQVSPQNSVRSDVPLDLGLSNQGFDTALPQTLNGQTSLSTASALAVQDISGQKALTSIAATMKADTSATPRMVNEQITIAINKNIVNGQNNFSIRLNPAELGKIDIKLEFLADGKMQAAMIVENEKTLTMLQRDQGALDKALQDAGINLADKNMSFSLMKQNQENNAPQFAGNNVSSNDDADLENLIEAGTIQEIRMGYSTKTIDISV